MTCAVEFVRRCLKGEPIVLQPAQKRRRTSQELQSSPSAYPVAVKLEPAQLAPLQGPLHTEYISDEEIDDVEFTGMLQLATGQSAGSAAQVKLEDVAPEGGMVRDMVDRLDAFLLELEDQVSQLLSEEPTV
eukprot:6491313-Amphidinium_carterae.4